VECFTEDTWEYIGGQMQTYFQGMEIVGWVHCQPGFGSFLMSRDETFHKEYFKEKWQVLFVLDSIDRLDAFYIYSPEQRRLQPARGYFIYYDKNMEMQEYMLENSLIRPREAAQMQEEGQKTAETAQTSQTEEGGRRHRKPTQAERMDAAGEIRRVLQRRETRAKRAKKEHDRALAAVSVMLCIVCVCMGFAVVSSLNRLQMLETELVAMQTSYEALAEGFEDVRVQSVFAVQQAEQVEQAMQEEQKKLLEAAKQAEKIRKEEQAKQKERVSEKKTYCVESGDSLGYISTKFYGTSSQVAKIMEANALKNADMIFEGQVLLIP
jgi:nucleoid-associated protein YgaU